VSHFFYDRVYGGQGAQAYFRQRTEELRKRQCPSCHLRALLIENASGRPICPRCLGGVVAALCNLDLSIPGFPGVEEEKRS